MDTTQLPRFTFEAVKANQHPGTRWKLALSYLYTPLAFQMCYMVPKLL